MKTKLFFSKISHLLILTFLLILLINSCTKDEETFVLQETKGVVFDYTDFFDIYAADYKDLFSEEIWKLMSTNPELAMIKLTQTIPNYPNSNVEWIPYVAKYKEAIVSIAPYYNDFIMDGMLASAEGAGAVMIDNYGEVEDFMNTEQISFMSGPVKGEAISESLKFDMYYDIIDKLVTPKKQTTLLDAIMINYKNSGEFEGTTGFALRKAIIDFTSGPTPGPIANLDGEAEIVVIGYIIIE